MGCPARNRTFHVNCGEAKVEKKKVCLFFACLLSLFSFLL